MLGITASILKIRHDFTVGIDHLIPSHHFDNLRFGILHLLPFAISQTKVDNVIRMTYSDNYNFNVLEGVSLHEHSEVFRSYKSSRIALGFDLNQHHLRKLVFNNSL